MKVCTDACIFGAWVARHIPSAAHVLDIGSGTGLLSLIYAQENAKAIIDAVEIDPLAARQAIENTKNSLWADRINIHQVAIQQFNSGHQYDLIISNPPFFENDLRSPNVERNNAMHDTSLTLEELSNIIEQYLSPDGSFSVLLPYHRSDYFITLMNNHGLHLNIRLLVKQSLQHDYFRSILCFTKKPVDNVQEEELVIRVGKDIYSEEFIQLLKEYYLYL